MRQLVPARCRILLGSTAAVGNWSEFRGGTFVSLQIIAGVRVAAHAVYKVISIRIRRPTVLS